MSSRKFTRDPEVAAQKRADAISRLEAGLDAVTTSEGYRAWLRAASKFHQYSFSNQIAIAIQRPDATRVAGFKTWLELKRSVRKGAKGIQIIVPHVVKAKQEDHDAGEDAATPKRDGISFGLGYVFDVSDTDGEELPTLGYKHTEGETAGALWGRVLAVAVDRGYKLETDDRDAHGASGYFNPRSSEIWYRSTLSLDGSVSTVLHELAHAFDYAAHAERAESFDYVDHRGDRETVAESVAYIAADHFGLNTDGETFTYLASWAKDKAVLKARMGEIQKLADALINALEAVEIPIAA
jgi:antirestriction protein ArdC